MKKIINLTFVWLAINLITSYNLHAENCIYQCADGSAVQGGLIGGGLEICGQMSHCNKYCENKGGCMWDMNNKSLPRQTTSTATKSGFIKA